jgi:hypothetical protein
VTSRLPVRQPYPNSQTQALIDHPCCCRTGNSILGAPDCTRPPGGDLGFGHRHLPTPEVQLLIASEAPVSEIGPVTNGVFIQPRPDAQSDAREGRPVKSPAQTARLLRGASDNSVLHGNRKGKGPRISSHISSSNSQGVFSISEYCGVQLKLEWG